MYSLGPKVVPQRLKFHDMSVNVLIFHVHKKIILAHSVWQIIIILEPFES